MPVYAASGPKHLISWAAQLYDQVVPYEKKALAHEEREYQEGQKIIFDRAAPLFLLADIKDWTREDVIVETLEATWGMETSFRWL